MGMVKDEAPRDAEAPAGPLRGQRHVNLCGQCVRKIVERQGGFVTEDPFAPAPEPEDNQVLVVAGGKVDEPIDAATDAPDPPVPEVLHQQLGVVARLGGLSRGEMSLLGRGDLVQAVPVGPG
jgi:hypothetical protein